MLLPWKQFRPSVMHGLVCQLSFTYRVAERVKGKSVHVSASTACKLSGGCTFAALMMKKSYTVSRDPVGRPMGGYPLNAG